ncbi:helix-turn-helix domain-containing protein [Kitasatospora sp. NPDC057015]|uniref:helix-turn-helix domain-containing protein n=1 Tax=Kitasatospora sp. NPDC057015 TaxID=3346001 RepID=UPI00363FF15E
MRYFSAADVHWKLGLVCLGVGLQRGPLPAVGPRTLDHHVAVVISSGRGWFSSNGGPRHQVLGPALLWLRPGVEHHYAPNPETGWVESFVGFSGSAVAAYAELGLFSPDDAPVPLSATGRINDAVSRIVRAARGASPLFQVEASAAVHDVLIALWHARTDVTHEGDPLLRSLARNALLPISVEDHAARCGIALPVLRDVVRRSTGVSLKEYLITVRLDVAKELLATTELPVHGVAARVGHTDAAYFSRMFTKRVGVSPVRFRKEQRRTVPGGWSESVPKPDNPPMVDTDRSPALHRSRLPTASARAPVAQEEDTGSARQQRWTIN